MRRANALLLLLLLGHWAFASDALAQIVSPTHSPITFTPGPITFSNTEGGELASVNLPAIVVAVDQGIVPPWRVAYWEFIQDGGFGSIDLGHTLPLVNFPPHSETVSYPTIDALTGRPIPGLRTDVTLNLTRLDGRTVSIGGRLSYRGQLPAGEWEVATRTVASATRVLVAGSGPSDIQTSSILVASHRLTNTPICHFRAEALDLVLSETQLDLVPASAGQWGDFVGPGSGATSLTWGGCNVTAFRYRVDGASHPRNPAFFADLGGDVGYAIALRGSHSPGLLQPGHVHVLRGVDTAATKSIEFRAILVRTGALTDMPVDSSIEANLVVHIEHL